MKKYKDGLCRFTVSFRKEEHLALHDWLEALPRGHRSARVCEMLNRQLRTEQSLAAVLDVLMENQQKMLQRLRSGASVMAAGSKEVEDDIAAALLELGQ